MKAVLESKQNPWEGLWCGGRELDNLYCFCESISCQFREKEQKSSSPVASMQEFPCSIPHNCLFGHF